MLLELKYKTWNGVPLTTVALGEDGKRYFKEGKRWLCDGRRAREWRALLLMFRRSDWGDRSGFHLSGCSRNQYLVAECSQECQTFTRQIHNRFGGFPENFSARHDERNEYRSSVETYG